MIHLLLRRSERSVSVSSIDDAEETTFFPELFLQLLICIATIHEQNFFSAVRDFIQVYRVMIPCGGGERVLDVFPISGRLGGVLVAVLRA